MAVTVAVPAGESVRHSAGDQWLSVRTITLDNSYLAGGEPVTAAQVGMGKVTAANGVVLDTAVAVSRVSALIQTDGSILLKAYAVGMIAEIANAVDLSGTTVQLRCWGQGA